MSQIKTDVLQLRPGTLPSNPLNGQLAVDSSDNDKLKKYSTTTSTWSEIAGSGQGGINYISNYDFESATTGWAAYADAAAATPADGTGGSPNVTITRSTSSPLRGLASGLITKDAANRQGQGVSYDFTIASADQAKIMSCAFEYAVASGTFAGGTDSTTGDLNVYIYDVTNATLIQPQGYKVLGSVSGQFYKHQFNFQTASNSTSYRLILHVASTSASAWSLKFDNIQVSPQSLLLGSVVTDPVAYTPVFQGFGTPTSVNIVSWRSGKYLFVEGSFVAGTTTAAEARIGLGFNGVAGNVTVDSASLPAIRTVGKAAVSNLAARDYQVLAEPSVSYLTVGYQESTSTSALTKQNGNAVNSTGNTFTFFARVPITGWASSVQMSQDSIPGAVAMSAQLSTTSVPNNSETTFTAWTSVVDTHGAFASGVFTAPVSDLYEFSASAIFAANATGSRYITVKKNTSTSLAIAQNSTATSGTVDTNVVIPTTIVKLNAGDTLILRGFQNSGGSLSMQTGVNTVFSIRRLMSYAAIPASELVAARYVGCTTSITSTAAKITFTTKQVDTHGLYSSGTYTAPTRGMYGISAAVRVQTTPVVDHTASLFIYKNGSAFKQFLHRFKVASTTSTDIQVNDQLLLNAGDTIEIYCNAEGTSPSIVDGTTVDNFAITRLAPG